MNFSSFFKFARAGMSYAKAKTPLPQFAKKINQQPIRKQDMKQMLMYSASNPR